MFGKSSRINRLAARKQMLIAESELNRAHLMQDWQVITCEVHALADEARLLRSVVSAGAALVSGFAAFRRKKAAAATGKTSWLQAILNGAGEISKLWKVFCAPPRETRNK